ADWVGWNRTVLDRLKSEIDYISLHTYIGNRENNLEKFLAASRDLDDRIEVVKGQIQAVRVGNSRARPIYIAFDEWNVWYRSFNGTTEYEIASKGLEEIYNFEDTLAMGMFLNAFIRHADVVKMANLAQLVNVIAPIFTNKDGLFLQTIYFPIVEYAKQRGRRALDVLVDSPQYKPDDGRPLGYLDVSARDLRSGEVDDAVGARRQPQRHRGGRTGRLERAGCDDPRLLERVGRLEIGARQRLGGEHASGCQVPELHDQLALGLQVPVQPQ